MTAEERQGTVLRLKENQAKTQNRPPGLPEYPNYPAVGFEGIPTGEIARLIGEVLLGMIS